MGSAVFTDDFRPRHAQARIFFKHDMRKIRWIAKARPSGARVKLRVRREEFSAANRAGVHSLLMIIHVRAREGRFGPSFTRYASELG